MDGGAVLSKSSGTKYSGDTKVSAVPPRQFTGNVNYQVLSEMAYANNVAGRSGAGQLWQQTEQSSSGGLRSYPGVALHPGALSQNSSQHLPYNGASQEYHSPRTMQKDEMPVANRSASARAYPQIVHQPSHGSPQMHRDEMSVANWSGSNSSYSARSFGDAIHEPNFNRRSSLPHAPSDRYNPPRNCASRRNEAIEVSVSSGASAANNSLHYQRPRAGPPSAAAGGSGMNSFQQKSPSPGGKLKTSPANLVHPSDLRIRLLAWVDEREMSSLAAYRTFIEELMRQFRHLDVLYIVPQLQSDLWRSKNDKTKVPFSIYGNDSLEVGNILLAKNRLVMAGGNVISFGICVHDREWFCLNRKCKGKGIIQNQRHVGYYYNNDNCTEGRCYSCREQTQVRDLKAIKRLWHFEQQW